MTSDELLYTDLDGQHLGLDDVIADGLDRDYSARFPMLRQLLDTGSPLEQLHACAMLASWGVRDGLLKVIEWAREPEAVPWAGAPVEIDRFSGVDSAFVLLTDSLRTAREYVPLGEVADHLRRLAVYDLLVIYHRVYFDRSMFILLDLDPNLARAEMLTIGWAIDQALAAMRNGWPGFDLPTQIAFLLGPYATLDDAGAADRAETLISSYPVRDRTLRELAYALGSGTGPATRGILERLARWESPSVRREAAEWLARRGASAP
ncbi:MAG: hypothetical protein M3441_03070 [Chloroflexota bacterium]|nr:hypothetical protein [Chloroflexota bacterium]